MPNCFACRLLCAQRRLTSLSSCCHEKAQRVLYCAAGRDQVLGTANRFRPRQCSSSIHVIWGEQK
ncbi:hypothetical protein BDV24DRAFT_134507 [Aspergillus arachidicola]|uniref:Uncharacterized protein n=1 Tax=Aspergillus arachidicola TaxID=656916 RepID=A0A5N6Y6J1_9EURO|nr:hypothetical protein BDV24DRAFT_134507 [Aspergillus arachidicola]